MSIDVNETSVTSSSNKITLSDGSKTIILKKGQIIETSTYVACGTYVFKKGVDIPLVYFTQRRTTSGTNGSYVYNTTTDAVSSASGVTYTKSTPGYISALKAVLAHVSTVTYKISQCVSNVGYSSTVGTTEASRFNSNHDFVSSNYSLSNPAPTARGNLETIPNTNNYNSVTVTGKNITVTCKTNNNSFVSITARI